MYIITCNLFTFKKINIYPLLLLLLLLLIFSLMLNVGVFWLNIAESGVYLCYRHCFKLIRELRKESEFRQRYCRNSTKI